MSDTYRTPPTIVPVDDSYDWFLPVGYQGRLIALLHSFRVQVGHMSQHGILIAELYSPFGS